MVLLRFRKGMNSDAHVEVGFADGLIVQEHFIPREIPPPTVEAQAPRLTWNKRFCLSEVRPAAGASEKETPKELARSGNDQIKTLQGLNRHLKQITW
ncbi:hypothetical protein RUM43_014382 [Polyplax serrata]|uniref:Uncharacterized protein n=1 Tax=Polyplax serrata TaxID=468196 RepID=A0AAN8NVH0_POLSC